MRRASTSLPALKYVVSCSDCNRSKLEFVANADWRRCSLSPLSFPTTTYGGLQFKNGASSFFSLTDQDEMRPEKSSSRLFQTLLLDSSAKQELCFSVKQWRLTWLALLIRQNTFDSPVHSNMVKNWVEFCVVSINSCYFSIFLFNYTNKQRLNSTPNICCYTVYQLPL